MKTLITLSAVGLLALTLTGCSSPAEKHATLEDCAATYADKGLSAEDLNTVCTRILDKVGQKDFDESYLPDN